MNPSLQKPNLVVQNLSVSFPGEFQEGLHVLSELSFSVYPQNFVSILGPSGCGKSTLLRVLAGLLKPSSGHVVIHGEKVNGSAPGVGLVFQDANLMPWRTVVQNIMLPLEIARNQPEINQKKAQEMIDFVGLNGFENTYPGDLSGGMAQRVAIARALIHDPDILLLDEPFGSLDALTRDRMGNELLRIWTIRQKTVLLVTHSISEAIFLADRVIVLSSRPGKIRLDLEIPLPRPRDPEIKYTPQFGRLARRVKDAIR